MFERADFFFLQFISPFSFIYHYLKNFVSDTSRKNISEKNNNWKIFLEGFRKRVKIQII